MRMRYVLMAIGLVILAGGAWWLASQNASAPLTEEADKVPFSFELVDGETPRSWNFKGAYTGNQELEARARAMIKKDEELFGQEGYTDYELFIGISNQYNLMGDGAREYEYLKKALEIDHEHTGLAWHNMGKLLERLGAQKSARVAYDAMMQAQPSSQYALSRLEFLKAHMSADVQAIQQAEAQLAALKEY